MKNRLAAFILIVTFAKAVFAEDTLAKAYFDEQRNFYVSAPTNGQWLSHNDLRIFAYADALKTCKMSRASLEDAVHSFLQNSVGFWSQLESIFPDIEKLARAKDIFIAIDDFGIKRNMFRSYHLKDSPRLGQSLIVIDCLEFQNKAWQALLGHELIHAVLADANIPVWIEEILAQTAELSLSGQWPTDKIEQLRSLSFLPSPISTHRPFLDNSTYAMNFLFGQYLIKKLGGFSVLRALNPFILEPGCAVRLNLEDVICRIKLFNRQLQIGPQDLSWLDSHSLLQNFTAAMLINRQEIATKGFYSVPGWSGFSAPSKNFGIQDISTKGIEKGSFIRAPKLQAEVLKQQFLSKAYIFRVIQGSSFYNITEDFNFLLENKKNISDQVIVLF